MVTTSPTSWNVEQKTFISGGGNELPCSLTREPDTDPDFPTIWPRCISNIHPNHNHASEPNHCAKKNTQTFTIFHYLSLIPVYSSIIRGISHVTTRMVLHISWLLKLPPHNVFRILLQKNKIKGWNHVGRFEASVFLCDTGSKWQHFETWLFDFRIHGKIWSRVATNKCLLLDLLYIALLLLDCVTSPFPSVFPMITLQIVESLCCCKPKLESNSDGDLNSSIVSTLGRLSWSRLPFFAASISSHSYTPSANMLHSLHST